MTEDHNADGGQPNTPPATVRSPMPLRTKALLGLLALMGVTFAVNAAHVRLLENELQTIADSKASDLARSKRSGQIVETASVVTATKEYLVYGQVYGKIEVYLKDEKREGRFVGIDFFFSRGDGEWTETESGMCTDAECQIRGAKAFANE